MSRRGERLAEAGIVLLATALAFILRRHYAALQSLGYEENYTRAIAVAPGLSGVWDTVKATESTPPLFYVLTWLWVKLTASASALSLRTVSILAGTLTVPAAHQATRRFTGRKTALAAAALAAVSPILVDDGIYARSYALFVLAATLSVWALGALLAEPSRARWALWALTAIGVVWTHYFGGFLVVAEAIVLAAYRRGAWRELAAALGGVVVCCAPLWPMFKAQSGATQHTDFIAARALSGRLEDVVRQFPMGINVPSAALEAAGIAVFGLAVLAALVRGRGSPSTRTLLALMAIAAGLPVLTALTGIDDHLLARNLLGTWIALAALAAGGLVLARGLPLVVYLALCLAAVTLSLGDWRYQGSADWRDTAALLGHRAAGEPIAVMPADDVNVAGYYLHRAALAAPVSTAGLWLIVEPARPAGSRALEPVSAPPLALFGAGLHATELPAGHGFRIFHLQGAAPVSVAPVAGGTGSAPAERVLAP